MYMTSKFQTNQQFPLVEKIMIVCKNLKEFLFQTKIFISNHNYGWVLFLKINKKNLNTNSLSSHIKYLYAY